MSALFNHSGVVSRSRLLTAGAALMLAVGLGASSAHATFTGLGSAASFALLTVPGNSTLNLSNVVVTGNVGVGSGGHIKLMAPSTINGNLYLRLTAATQETASAGTLNGSLVENSSSLDTIISDVTAASTQAAALSPTQTINANVTSGTTIVGNGGINVIQINGNINLSNASLLFSGSASDVFIVNITGTLTLGGSGGVGPTGSVTDNHILLNFTGAGTMNTHVGNFVDATILAPNQSATFDGSFGSVFAGAGATLGLLSGATLHATPFVIPTPGAGVMLAMGAGLLARRRQRSAS